MNLTLTIPESEQPPITVEVGGTTELTSYVSQVAALPDYPATFPPDLTGVTPADIGAEPALGNPDTNGKVLSSTTGGTRSWITPSGTVDNAAVNAAIATNPGASLGSLNVGYLPTKWSAYVGGVDYEAVSSGVGATAISVRHVISGTGSSVLSVTVSGNAITVTAGSATTRASVVSAVNGTPAAAALVTASANVPQSIPIAAENVKNLQPPLSHDKGWIVAQDMKGLRWLKEDGSLSNNTVYYWEDHDTTGGELLLSSSNRIALAPGERGAIQIGLSYGASSMVFAYMQSRFGPTATDPLSESYPLFLNCGTYGIAAQDTTWSGIQGRATASGDNETVFFAGSTFPDEVNNLDGTMPEICAVTVDGFRDPRGNAPAFVTLADGMITVTCSTTKGFQNHAVTLAENSTLAFSGATAGMRGTILITQDATGSSTLTLPANAAYQSAIVLTTTPLATDRLDWLYDGNYFYFDLIADLTLPFDADASAFLTAAGISEATAEAVAINRLVLDLKKDLGSGVTLWGDLIVEAWPVIGGSSTAHSKGIKGDYNSTFGAGVTHDANGITGNATSTGWMNSGVNISALGLRDSIGLYCYNREPTTTAGKQMFGCTGTNARFYVTEAAGVLYGAGPCSGGLNTCAVIQSPNDRGHYWFGRTSSTSATIRFNSSSETATNNAVSAPTDSPFFLAVNNGAGAGSNATNANLAFCAVTKGLTADQYNALKTAVDAFQTALGRQNV